MGQLKAVIFDHTTLLGNGRRPFARSNPALHEEIKTLLESLIALGIRIVVVSTHARNMRNDLATVGLPDNISYFSKDDMGGERKGSLVWMITIARTVGCEIYETLYVGDDEQDWRTAINQSVMYLHADWSKYRPNKPMLAIKAPRDVLVFATHFLLNLPRWTLQYSSPDDTLKIRCLLSARDDEFLPSTAPSKQFTLKNIFYAKIDVHVGLYSARTLLMHHILSSLYLEGLMNARPILTIYPSSSPRKGKDSQFTVYLDPISKFFRSRYREDLLLRHTEAKDTSFERYQRRQVTFLDQANTVCLNRKYREEILGKDVIVFDDFTTTGMSLEWAKLLLQAAGASSIILVSAGKFWRIAPVTHQSWSIRPNLTIDPFTPATYTITAFRKHDTTLDLDDHILPIMQKSFGNLCNDEPYL